MESVPERVSFPKIEEELVEYWKTIDAFQTSVKLSEGKPEYSFYDGPPFATGLPHYGHILAGTIKDTVTRYAHQTGHHVVRRFGWDCHGLPIEFEIDKQLGIKTRDEVLKMGIPQYNATCRSIVMRYSSEWETVVTRLGRWIDFKNDYKTMDKSFMESVWWVFKQIYDKGFVYYGYKVMPYSTACTTPLSNFEANMAYKDVDDPTVIVGFPLVDQPDVSLLAWTTTPWTLPSNLALCVNPDLDYVHIVDKATGAQYIMCEARTVELYKSADQYTVKAKFKGTELKGKKYVPLFNYFEEEKSKGAFQVLTDKYVTDASGTGIVHQAPGFGEDDFRVCLAAGIVQKGAGIVCPVDANGRFTSQVTDFAGQYVKDADKDIVRVLKDRKRLVHKGTLRHSYPFCWRSDTPLIYRAVGSWFVRVENVRDQLLANNETTYWVPEYVKEKRFANWLADAQDWCVSRNRFWGTPIPVWMSEDGQEIKVVGSVAELEQLTGHKVTDLHRESIDHLTIPSSRGPQFGVLRRIDEVFDCWFESGSMPYAQNHYPFENKELFEKGFPADFIAEGLDQTRGWFYTLLVLSTLLFGKAPFKNLVCNGLVLAADGKKMSKRLKNYPDPMNIVNEYGADALRLYLIDSPVVRAESLRFQEKGVRDIVKDVLLPWFNAYRFLTETVAKFNKGSKDKFQPDHRLALSSTNTMDRWVMAATASLIKFVRAEMAAYRLYTVVPRLVRFIEQLTNWFVRLNRKRLKGLEGEADTRTALSVLFDVLLTVTRAMAPFTPFITEYFYQNLRRVLPESERRDSVHYLDFPEFDERALNKVIEDAVERMQSVIQLGRQARDRRALPLKFPLLRITVIHKDPAVLKDVQDLSSYILSELNVKEVVTTSDESMVVTVAKPDLKKLGERLRKDAGKVFKAIKELSHDQIRTFQQQGKLELEGHTITADELMVSREFKGDTTRLEAAWDDNVLVVLDVAVDEAMRQEGLAREVVNRVQKLRKKAGVRPTDPIEVFYEFPAKADKKDEELRGAVRAKADFIHSLVGVGFAPATLRNPTSCVIQTEEAEVAGSKFTLSICRLDVKVDHHALRPKCPSDDYARDVDTYLTTRDHEALMKEFGAGTLHLKLNGHAVELHLGKDVYPSTYAYAKATGKL